MDPKLLTESGWKAIVAKFKIKDNGLQRALNAYEHVDENKYDERLKRLVTIGQLAVALKKSRDLASEADALKYLTDVADAAEDQKAEVAKQKALAAKAEALAKKNAQADAKKKAETDKKAQAQALADEEAQTDREKREKEEEQEEEEEEGDYVTRLWAALRKLRSPLQLTYQFIVSDVKPLRLLIAKKITPKHRRDLMELTGSKRILRLGTQPGTVQFTGGKFVFTVQKALPGLARKFQLSLKHYLGRRLPIMVGTESAEGDEEDEGAKTAAHSGKTATAPKSPPPQPPPPELLKAPQLWHKTRQSVESSVIQLKAAILKDYAGEAPALLSEIEKNMTKLDGILDKLDKKLADSLAKAGEAKDRAARSAELRNAQNILKDYLRYVVSERLITQIDENPFGVQTNVKRTLVASLNQMAQAVKS